MSHVEILSTAREKNIADIYGHFKFNLEFYSSVLSHHDNL